MCLFDKNYMESYFQTYDFSKLVEVAKNQFKCQQQKTLTKAHENINTIRYIANWVKVTSIDLPNLPQSTLLRQKTSKF